MDVWTGTGFGFALTWPWNLLNRYPIVDVPLGVVEDRMPSGMQVIGQTFTDLDTFQFASNWSTAAAAVRRRTLPDLRLTSGRLLRAEAQALSRKFRQSVSLIARHALMAR